MQRRVTDFALQAPPADFERRFGEAITLEYF